MSRLLSGPGSNSLDPRVLRLPTTLTRAIEFLRSIICRSSQSHMVCLSGGGYHVERAGVVGLLKRCDVIEISTRFFFHNLTSLY